MAPAFCEKSPCAALCRGLACFASRDVTANRRAVVKTLVGVHVCCVVVAVVACLGALETKALKSTAWASVTMDTVGGPNGALYVGFRGVWVDGAGARNGSAPSPIDGYYAWDDFEDLVPSDESGGVEDCAAASTGLFSTSVVGAASLLPSMNALLARSDAARDGGCNKFLSVVPSFLGAASTIAALRSFRADCFDGFPSTLSNGTRTYASLDKTLGYGFGCEFAVACVGVFTAAVMLFLGTAEPEEARRVIPEPASKPPPPPPPSAFALSCARLVREWGALQALEAAPAPAPPPPEPAKGASQVPFGFLRNGHPLGCACCAPAPPRPLFAPPKPTKVDEAGPPRAPEPAADGEARRLLLGAPRPAKPKPPAPPPEPAPPPSPRRRAESEHARRVLETLFLTLPGNRDTVRLLMRGMPVPCCFGFPNTDGTWLSNWRAFCCQFHPTVSIFYAHALHPFSRKERLVVFVCSVAFNFLWTDFTIRIASRHVMDVDEYERGEPDSTSQVALYTIKYAFTILYAVLIRQLVICPCFYAPLLAGDLDVTSPGAARAVVERTRKLHRFKSAGDRLLMVLFVVHGLCIAYVLFHVLWDTIDDGGAQLWYEIGISEGLNFFVWFLKMFPLFFLLFPVDRARWFQGGALGDYVLCRRSLAAYRRSPHFLDASFPRCVEPETREVHEARLSTFFDELFQREYNLSTFAHSDKGLRDHCATPRDDLGAAP